MDWFYVVFGFFGLLAMLSAVYEWTWIWKLARGGYLPNQVGWHNTRLLYLVGGSGVLGAAISLSLQSLLSSNSVLFFAVGFLLASGLTAILFNSRQNQSIVSFLLNKEKK